MVSLRRRRLLGLRNAGKASGSDDDGFPKKPHGSTAPLQGGNHDVKPPHARLVPGDGLGYQKEGQLQPITQQQEGGFNNEELGEQKAGMETAAVYQYTEVKRRKQHKRKHRQGREPCSMRGVYFKNMKWQAAIKVDKKQIHLGTVNSQVDAAKLYDRAAFMCGREPNYELTEEEKQELRCLSWTEFLARTRNAIVTKKNQKRIGGATQRIPSHKLQEDSEHEQGVAFSSSSFDTDDDASAIL